MPLKITKKPSPPKATITKELKESGKVIAEEATQEQPNMLGSALIAPDGSLAGKLATTPWCEVGFEASYTHNLGNFQSARVGVSLVIPCQHAEVDAVYDIAQKWVNDRLQKCVEELTAGEG